MVVHSGDCMTEALYWKKPYTKSFTAKVVDVRKNAIILNKTLFYATAGNQIHDTGILTINKKEFRVINVEKDDNETYFHFTEPKPTKELIESAVKGKIDWDRRYSVMKAHTAQHIISAIMMKLFRNKTVQANIKPGEFSIEFEQKITEEQLESTIQEVNQVFSVDSKSIISHVLNHDDAVNQFSTKIRGKIPKVDTVRILEVDGIDFNTCGGTHVKKSNEIGPVYISKIHSEREVDFYCGGNALNKLSVSNVNLVFSQKQLNCSLEEFPKVFSKKLQDCEELTNKRKELSVLIMELLQTSPYEDINGLKFRFLGVELPNKIMFNGFRKFESESILVVKLKPEQYLILSSSKKFIAKLIVEKLKEKYGGKGGGSPFNAQILFDKEPKNLQEDIKQILAN